VLYVGVASIVMLSELALLTRGFAVTGRKDVAVLALAALVAIIGLGRALAVLLLAMAALLLVTAASAVLVDRG
jgi:hypothetical protein